MIWRGQYSRWEKEYMESFSESQTLQECSILSLPFSPHMHYLSLAFVLHPVDEVVLYPFALTIVNAAS